MESKNIAIGIVVVLAVAVGAYLIWNVGAPISNLFPSNEKVDEYGNVAYVSEELKLSFDYPSNYILQEKTVDDQNRLHKTIILMDKTAYAQVPPDSDGPTSITIDIFQNNLDKQTAEQFIRGSSFSNYKLGDGVLEEGTIGVLQAFRYNWDGLYKGESIVTASPDYIYMWSVTSLTPEDQIRTDFYNILNSSKIGE